MASQRVARSFPRCTRRSLLSPSQFQSEALPVHSSTLSSSFLSLVTHTSGEGDHPVASPSLTSPAASTSTFFRLPSIPFSPTSHSSTATSAPSHWFSSAGLFGSSLSHSAFALRGLAGSPFLHPAYFEIYNRQRQLLPLNHLVPTVAVDAWVAPNAVLVGGVKVRDKSSVWYGAVLRADLNYITIGYSSNIQDRVVIHPVGPTPGDLPTETRIGHYVTVGQASVLTSCEVEDEVIIGMRCIVLKNALIERNAVLADGSVVQEGQLIPSGELWAGNPAQFVRALTADEKAEIPGVAEAIANEAGEHASEFLPYSSAYIDAERLAESLRAAQVKKHGEAAAASAAAPAAPAALAKD